jgi:hypothetical protein
MPGGSHALVSSLAARGIVRAAGFSVDHCVCLCWLPARAQKTQTPNQPLGPPLIDGACRSGWRARRLCWRRARARGFDRISTWTRTLTGTSTATSASSAAPKCWCVVSRRCCAPARGHGGLQGAGGLAPRGAVVGEWLCAHVSGDGALGCLHGRRASSLGWWCWGARCRAAGVLPSTKTG